MRIRTRLTLQFALLVAAILLMAGLFIYYLSSEYRKQSFFERVESKALSTVRLFADLEPESPQLLKRLDRTTALLEREDIRIFNEQGKELYNSNQKESIPVSDEMLEKVRHHKVIRFSVAEREGAGLLFEDEGNRFIAFAAGYDKYGLNKLYNLRLILIIVSVFSFTIAGFAGWLYAGRAVKPIADVVRQVDRISASKLDARVNEGNGTDEIALLAITFNKMLRRLQEAFEMQKSFVSNASHELRTPLTALSGQIEVALLKDRSPEEYRKLLESLHEDIRSMVDLTNGLLTLAQASVDKSKILREPIRIDEILWQSRAELLRAHPDYHITIDYQQLPEEEDSLIMPGNEKLLGIAFLNLMDNACKFSDDHRTEVTLLPEGGKIELSFRDWGRGISKGEMKNIFEPFYRASNAWQVKGHGLGLSLTERIVRLHNGDIHVNSEVGKGTVFRLQFRRPAKINADLTAV